jgi:hypothetical protein
MLHQPYSDNFKATTSELICAVVNRLDAPASLFSLLALIAEMSGELPIDRQWRTAQSLRDAAEVIEQRPAVRDWVSRLMEGAS